MTEQQPGAWRRKAARTYRAPDGSTVAVDGVDTTGAWCSVFKAAVAGRILGFTVAERGESQSYADSRMPGHTTVTQSFRGGVIAVRHNAQEAIHSWTGPWWEILYGANRPDRSIAETQAVFAALRLQDSPTGLRVTAWGSAKVTASSLQVVKQVPRVGELEINPLSEVSLPSWSGRRVKHGEVWSQALGGESAGRARSAALVHSGATAVSRLLAGPDSTTDDATALREMSALAVEWSPA